MKRAQLILLSVALVFSFSEKIAAQPAIDRPQDPNMKAGQLFAVRIAPVGKRIEVFVAGKEAASVNFADVQLSARIKVGRKSWFVTPEKKQGHFVLVTPTEVSPNSKAELMIRLNSKGQEEHINFELKPVD